MNILFVDLDQTLVDTKDIIEAAGSEPEGYGTEEHLAWLAAVTSPEALRNAPPVATVKKLVDSIIPVHTAVVFMTSRNNVDCAEATVHWMATQGYSMYPMIMREKGDLRSSGEMKASAALSVLGQYYPPDTTVTFLDDDPDGSLAAECKKNGWTLLKVVCY